MKALSLWQPWATLIALGIKTIETRSWGTCYRGPLLIHAAKKRVELFRDVFPYMPRAHQDAFVATLIKQKIMMNRLPFGKVVARVNLVDCIPFTLKAAKDIDPSEIPFGTFGEGRWMWKLADVYPVMRPYAAVGRQGLFDLEEPTAKLDGEPQQEATT